MAILISYNPANGEKVGESVVSTPEDIQKAVEKAHAALNAWKDTSFSDRAAIVRKFRKLLVENQEKLSQLITKEMGKPISESREEIEWELEFIDWYCDNVERVLGEKVLREDEKTIYKTVWEPYGVCASIAPWNFPVTMASTGITAQLLAGNTVIFKPSEYTTLSQKLFVDLFNQAGLPEGVLQCIVGDSTVGAALVDSDIDLLWFTGSTKVGQFLYKKCAEKFIPCMLELGGSSPGIVFADCDLEKTVDTVVNARFFNAGQVCNALKRLYVEKSIFDVFVKKLTERVQKVKLGPMVSEKQLNALAGQVEDAKKKGAQILLGGNVPDGKGYFYPPTILTDVTRSMRVMSEETFGPVLPVMPFESEEEAIRLANNTVYGLSGLVFTKDAARANRVARSLKAGGISVNMVLAYKPFAPMGGYKLSGLGREYGDEGFQDLAQLKYICEAK